jgi:tryptophan 2,3-dioxygenase
MDECPIRRLNSYGDALQVEALLQLQRTFSPQEPHHDELQYVIIHQVSELWFKLFLHEVDEIGRLLRAGDSWAGARLLRRATRIVGLIDGGFGLMETMDVGDYAAFRPNLSGGSGFQSAQFREMEVALGCARPETLNQEVFTPAERERLAQRQGAPSLWDSFVELLGKRVQPQAASTEAGTEAGTQADLRAASEAADLRAAYGEADLRAVMEELTALDNAIALWRFHHATMAERAIGAAVGTGGAGVEYLYQSARLRAFPALFAMRTALHQPLQP